jgi:PAS domain-containing protein
LRIIGTQIDIDARKSTEIILQRINHTLETLIHVAPVGIIGLDDTGEPVIWNPAASEILQSRTSSDPAVRALMQAIRQERSATARPYRFLPEKGGKGFRKSPSS